MYSARLAAWIIAVVVVYLIGGVTAGVFAAIIAFALSHADRENVFGFDPFIVRIGFTPEFLTETGIATAAQLVPPVPIPAPTEYWPRRDGITFTVLRLGLGGTQQNLIYWNDSRTFSTRIRHFLQFQEFERAAPTGSPARSLGAISVTPSLEIDQRGDALNVFVSDGSENRRKLAAVIPNCIFDAPRLRGGKLARRHRDAVLKRHGWTQDEPTDLGEHGKIPGEFQHRYLTIAVDYI